MIHIFFKDINLCTSYIKKLRLHGDVRVLVGHLVHLRVPLGVPVAALLEERRVALSKILELHRRHRLVLRLQ